MTNSLRPTKKQREMLNFIEQFIAKHGYGPSYRELAEGLDYNSVATVAAHVNHLIDRGWLHKRTNAARSLELTDPGKKTLAAAAKTWLVAEVDYQFIKAEHGELPIRELQAVLDTLKLFGLNDMLTQFQTRFKKLKNL